MPNTNKAPYELSGHFERKTKITLASALVFSLVGTIAFKIFYVNRRRKAYEEYNRTYDAEKMFHEMWDNDLLTAVE
ncbi:hypothetical protein RN001_010713 [Aquatica leii]|uniref:Mitochondrial cytochrome c oxidase subunit VIc/VIIs domain-containing protein n=1 Tax=Aquatica leii TaxID=1421715 RepID=A0AAN7SEM0_9COLE|nr:hypothetical protein RN001_010713 [Aquatica leii]